MFLVKDVGHFSVGRTIHHFICSLKDKNEDKSCLPSSNEQDTTVFENLREILIPRFGVCSVSSLQQNVMKLNEATKKQEINNKVGNN